MFYMEENRKDNKTKRLDTLEKIYTQKNVFKELKTKFHD